jgi:hypothetical protein
LNVSDIKLIPKWLKVGQGLVALLPSDRKVSKLTNETS